MARSYKGVHLKMHRVYSVEDLMRECSVSRNTVTNWVKNGLQPSDKRKPYLFRGASVNEFLKARRQREKKDLRPGEVICTACKTAVFPDDLAVHGSPLKSGWPLLAGTCPDCSAEVRKLGSQADIERLRGETHPNTTGRPIHEAKHETPGGIGKSARVLSGRNDRTIYAWQNYAGKFSAKTSDRHLAAIRFFEATLKEKRFGSLTREDVGAVRDKLLKMLDGEGGVQKSRSTVAHMASHLRDFLSWLLKQDEYKALPQDLVGYLDLPRAALQKGIGRQQRPYPELEEAEALLKRMSKQTAVDRRARAMFAIAFLTALRADTLTSLRIKHVDVEAQTVLQDASVSRTKNGKSLLVKWFSIPPVFAHEVVSWLEWLSNKDFHGDDALFPEASMLTGQRARRDLARPMNSKHAVEAAFRKACAGHDQRYTPHAARHTIKAEMDRRPLTTEERKAWSQNMGHESLQTTEIHYGQLSDERRFEVLERSTEREGSALGTLAELESVRDESKRLTERVERLVQRASQSAK